MAAPKKPKKARATPEKTRLTEIGEEAMRAALLSALEEQGWNLTHAGESLRIKTPSGVIRAIRSLGLGPQYEAAKAAGKVNTGRPKGA